jgi:predicted transcriptional regulator
MLEHPEEIKEKMTKVIAKTVMEQFLENTQRELEIYLKEKNPKTSEEMAELANRGPK